MTSNTSFLVLSILLCACGGSASNSSSSGGTSSGGATQAPGPVDPVRLPNGQVVANVLCGDDSAVSASGTWDALVSGSGGSEGSAVITVDGSNFVLATKESTLAFSVNGAAMTLTWKDGTKAPATVGVTRAASAIDLGVIPLAMGGQWTFAGNTANDSCTASFTGSGFNASCAKASMPVGTMDGALSGIRQQEKSSIFGALGGVWHLTAEGGSGSLDVTISGNVLTAVENRASSTSSPDWFTMKLCNAAASGKTAGGIEIAATRR